MDKKRTNPRRLVRIAATLTLAFSLNGISKSASAQTVTVDAGALGEYAAKIANFTKQLQVMDQITSVENNVLSINQQILSITGQFGADINNIGGQNLGNLMAGAEMGLNSAVMSGLVQLNRNVVSNITTQPLNQLSAIDQIAAIEASITYPSTGSSTADSMVSSLQNALSGTENVTSTASDINNNLWIQSVQPTEGNISDMNLARRSFLEGTITASLAESDAITQNTAQSDSTVTTNIDNDRNQAQTTRAQIEVNSLALAKIIDTDRTGLTMLSTLTRLESANSVANQDIRSPTTLEGPAPGN